MDTVLFVPDWDIRRRIWIFKEDLNEIKEYQNE